MADAIGPNLVLDVGIERIVSMPKPEQTQLPEIGKQLPTDAGYQLELQRVLYPDSLEQTLLKSLQPAIKSREFLAATRYQSMVEQVQASLRKQMAQVDSREDRKKLRKAITALEDIKDLRDLLNAYRHILHRA